MRVYYIEEIYSTLQLRIISFFLHLMYFIVDFFNDFINLKEIEYFVLKI